MKKITDDIIKAFEQCLKAVPIKELSARTGVGKKTLRRFSKHQNKYAPNEILRNIYPEIRRYILLKEASMEDVRPVRIGTAPRMGHYLEELNSDEKVLLDTFSALHKDDRKIFTANFEDAVRMEDVIKLEYKELSQEENYIISLFRAIKSEFREEFLMTVVDCAIEEMKKRRKVF